MGPQKSTGKKSESEESEWEYYTETEPSEAGEKDTKNEPPDKTVISNDLLQGNKISPISQKPSPKKHSLETEVISHCDTKKTDTIDDDIRSERLNTNLVNVKPPIEVTKENKPVPVPIVKEKVVKSAQTTETSKINVSKPSQRTSETLPTKTSAGVKTDAVKSTPKIDAELKTETNIAPPQTSSVGGKNLEKESCDKKE